MNTFGRVAVRAVELIEKGKASDPIKAWEQAAKKICAHSESMRKKGCPRCAFFGLCYAGLVKGVPKGSAKSSMNGDYTVRAAGQLKKAPSLASSPSTLWRKVISGSKTHNQQMNVLIALWETGRIN